ncbi:MAG: ATP-binding cassette domain-containing protein [Chitinivibrionales bacterium]|nr:ATP-binding cassette domain-containing protein [Chitinivibrionales bacterium]
MVHLAPGSFAAPGAFNGYMRDPTCGVYMALLEVDRVGKTYRLGVRARKLTAVKEVSFTVDEGVVGFVGPNGAGKTTTIKMILGLVRPSRGTIRMMGGESPSPSTRTKVAYVSEQPYFYGHLTVTESLRFIGSLRGLSPGVLGGEIDRVLDTVNLADAAPKKVGELSKGMQQRLNMAQALLGDPSFFIFDEPMSGLDPPGRSLFRGIFQDLRAAGKTVFFSTHILEDIERLCSRVIVLSKGEKTYDGTVEELLESGFEGTDLAVTGLDADTRSALESQGCRTAEGEGDTVNVHVPAGQDIHAVQRMLGEKGAYFESIVQRRKSLEELLYKERSGAHGT